MYVELYCEELIPQLWDEVKSPKSVGRAGSQDRKTGTQCMLRPLTMGRISYQGSLNSTVNALLLAEPGLPRV